MAFSKVYKLTESWNLFFNFAAGIHSFASHSIASWTFNSNKIRSIIEILVYRFERLYFRWSGDHIHESPRSARSPYRADNGTIVNIYTVGSNEPYYVSYDSDVKRNAENESRTKCTIELCAAVIAINLFIDNLEKPTVHFAPVISLNVVGWVTVTFDKRKREFRGHCQFRVYRY